MGAAGSALRLLLDTHIWLWYASGDERLRPFLRAAVASREHELWLSAVSVWEITLLSYKGRVDLDPDLRSWLPAGLAAAGVREAPLTAQIALAAHELNWSHRDPADRLLAATAKVMHMVLMTADERLLRLPGIAVLANR